MEEKILFLITPESCLDPKRCLSKNKLSKNCCLLFHCVLLKIVHFDIKNYLKRDVNGRGSFLTGCCLGIGPTRTWRRCLYSFKVFLHVHLVERFVCLVWWYVFVVVCWYVIVWFCGVLLFISFFFVCSINWIVTFPEWSFIFGSSKLLL